MASDADLDFTLAEVETRREAVASEMRQAEYIAAKVRNLQATRHLLFQEEWYLAPGSLTPWERSMHIAWEELRAASIRYGARFELTRTSSLVLRLELDLDRNQDEYVANGSQGHLDEHGKGT